jgi:hypothetical protein
MSIALEEITREALSLPRQERLALGWFAPGGGRFE